MDAKTQYAVVSALGLMEGIAAGAFQSGSVGEFDTRYAPISLVDSGVSALGDFSPSGKFIICCGDSTTEQFNQNQGGSQMVQTLRLPGEAWQDIAGFINFGGSGYTLKGFVEDAAKATPVIPLTGISAVSNWDTYGHKPTGAIPLATALNWRADRSEGAIWRICYGINDMILYSAVGGQSQDFITDYLASYLKKAITAIQKAYPEDYVIIECPNPMTARPFVSPGQGFPSVSAYPTFGVDLAADMALVTKWNYAARNAYLSIRNTFPRTVFNDSWLEVFGNSDTSLVATTQLPFLVNLVHPTGVADQARIRSISRLTSPSKKSSEGRRAEALAQGTANSQKPWKVYPGYFKDNPRYKLSAETTVVGVGANYIDLGMSYTSFLEQSASTVYLVVGDLIAESFTGYTAGASGTNTRLTGVSPSASFQAVKTRQNIQMFVEAINKLVADDIYVNSEAAKAKEYVLCSGLSGGDGYIDFVIPVAVGRISSKYCSGLKGGSLVVGGTSQQVISLASATINRAGTTAQRAVRISITGSWATLAGQPAAIVFSDSAPSPKVWERIVTPSAYIPLTATQNRAFLTTDIPILDGVTFKAEVLGPAVASAFTVDIYSLGFGSRTLLGTITVAANSGSSTLASGNPTTVPAGATYEASYSGAVSATTTLKITAIPN